MDRVEGTLDARCTARVVCVLVVAGLLTIFEPWNVLSAQTDVDRRLQTLENVRADARLASIETRLTDFDRRLDSIESIGKGILVVVFGQLAIAAIALRGRKGVQ